MVKKECLGTSGKKIKESNTTREGVKVEQNRKEKK